MSLINQVLRELDQRHAVAQALPAAVKAPPATAGTPRRRQGAIALSGLAIAAVSAVTWAMAARPAAPPQVETRSVAGVPLPPAAPAPAPVLTPVTVVSAAPISVSAATASVPPTHSAVRAELVEAPSPSPRHFDKASASAQTAVSAAPASSSAVPTESHIDKRTPARTAHERAEAAYQRGVAAHRQGQWDVAAAAYADALREERGFAMARQALAGVWIGQGRVDEAKGLLSEGVSLSPHHAGLAMMLARLLAERGELQGAADVLQGAAIASPSPEDNAFQAAVLQRLDRHAEAADLFAAALRVTPGNGVWWMGLGMSLAAQGRNDDAREAFNRARGSGTLSPELAAYVEQRLHQLL